MSSSFNVEAGWVQDKLGEVKKSKIEKYTNKQVLKVCFAYFVNLYWDF